MYHVPLAFQCIYGCSDERGENGDGEEGSKWRLPGFLDADDLVLCEESEENLRAMVGHFIEVCRRCLKVHAGKVKMMVLGGEEDWSVRLAWTGCDWSMCQNLSIWNISWMNQV